VQVTVDAPELVGRPRHPGRAPQRKRHGPVRHRLTFLECSRQISIIDLDAVGERSCARASTTQMSAVGR